MNARKFLTKTILGLLMGLLYSNLACGYPTIYPTGTTIYDPGTAYSSYILVPEGYVNLNHPDRKVREKLDSTAERFQWAYKGKRSTTARLIDMNGNTVHQWNVVPNYDARMRLTKEGHLVIIDEEVNGEIVEYDWDNNVVFKFKPPQGLLPHNDVQALPNGNIHVPVRRACSRRIPEGREGR